MRICFYNHDAQLYGASKSLLNLLTEVKFKDNVDILVVLPEKGPLEEQIRKLGIKCEIITSYLWVGGHEITNASTFLRYLFYLLNRLFGNLFSIVSHYKYLHQWNPDIIYTNTGVIPMGFILAKLLKVQHVWHIREFIDLDHKLRLDFGFRSLRCALNKSDLVITVSQPVSKYILPNPKTYLFTISNGVCKSTDFDKRISCWKKNNENLSYFTFSIVGFISNSKGQYDAVEAFSIVAKDNPNLKLIIAGHGGGAEFSKYISTINKKIKGKIEFVGHVHNIEEVYWRTHCLLMCSKNEAFGRVTIEAMSFGIPVIGYNNMGTSEIIKNNINGYLYGTSFPDLEVVMSSVIKDYEAALVIGFNGWKEAKNSYSQEQYANNILKALDNCIYSKWKK